jgi:hypothetical protein
MALAYYQDFIDQQQGNPALQAELADGRNRARRILDDLSTLQGFFQQMLVDRPAVQQNLKLSDLQIKRIAALRSAWSQRKPPPLDSRSDNREEEGRRRFLELARKNDRELGEILTANQRERLRQIGLQSQGLLAYHEPRVRDALRLTAQQKQELRRIEGSLFREMWPHPGGKPMDEVQRNAMKRAVALFSTEQAETWREMTGEPFEGALFAPPPGPG